MDLLAMHCAMQSFEQATMNKRWSAERCWQLEMGDAASIGAGCRTSSRTTQLLQNCDLPPPIKVFSLVGDGGESKAKSLQSRKHQHESTQNQSLLRALQLSQTRAREAERKALEANKFAEQMTALLLKDSMRLHAVQQRARLLETEISMLQQSASPEENKDEAISSATTSCIALALCFGIAGAGFLLTRYIL